MNDSSLPLARWTDRHVFATEAQARAHREWYLGEWPVEAYGTKTVVYETQVDPFTLERAEFPWVFMGYHFPTAD